MKKATFILGLILLTAVGYAEAQKKTPVTTKRQINQQKRIVHGVKNGALTKGEVIQLEKQQKHINRTKQVAKADGVVTNKERAIIQHKQNKASANVYVKKHNGLSRN
ncbi:hypothetical protein [Saccharicrinis sp. 156]|uniref:hypothetical protein n=1 Tax=Saccharicrinis sp. 156 TaxID=3417574 RepID=UPI003D34E330